MEMVLSTRFQSGDNFSKNGYIYFRKNKTYQACMCKPQSENILYFNGLKLMIQLIFLYLCKMVISS